MLLEQSQTRVELVARAREMSHFHTIELTELECGLLVDEQEAASINFDLNESTLKSGQSSRLEATAFLR